MSWDSYIDNLIAASGNNADKAAIISLDGGSPWTTAAHPANMNLQGQEGANIARIMKSGDPSSAQAGGIHAEGVKYQFLRFDDAMLGKKKDNGSISIMKSATAVVLGHTKEGGSQGDTNKAVSAIVEHLTSMNM